MPSPRASLSEFGWRRRVFSLIVLVTLGLFVIIGVVLLQPDLIAGLLGHETAGHISRHFRDPHHRVHDFTFSFLIGTAVVGMLAQLRRPSENVAGQLMALIPWVGLMLAFLLSNAWVPFAPAPILGAFTLLATILHPTWRNLFSSFSVSRVNRVMIALVIIAAVPLLTYASINVGLQRTLSNDHAALGHYGFMATFSFTVIGVGLLASLRPRGWRLSAWVAGFLPFLLGLISVVFRDVDSSLGLVWALAAIAWGVVFVAAAELTQDAESPPLFGSRDVISKSRHGDLAPSRDISDDTSTPRWVYVSGIMAFILILLFVVMHLTGGSFGGPHTVR